VRGHGIITIIRGASENTVSSLSMSPAITSVGLKRSLDAKGPQGLGMGVRLLLIFFLVNHSLISLHQQVELGP
jgi:hypothetical protein